MYKKQDKKMITMDILDILKKHSDVNHRLKQDDILKYLQNDYMMDVDRRAVADNLNRLIAEDEYDINYVETERGTGKNRNTIRTDFYINHEFDESELRLLIDGLLFSKYIPYSQCKYLIEKLEGLASEHFLSRMKHIKTLPNDMPRNTELFTTIEVVDEALGKNKKIKFNYTKYNFDKKLEIKKDEKGNDKVYIVSPVQMVANNSRYYLICLMDNKNDFTIFKIDKIINAEILKDDDIIKSKIKDLKYGFDLPKHMAEHLYMNIGKSGVVTFEFEEKEVDVIVEWFGKNILFKKKGNGKVEATVTINLNAMKYWAMQYSELVKILSPKSLIDDMKELTKDLVSKYSK